MAAPPKLPTDPEQVRQLIADGLTDTAIAELFGVSPQGVKQYRSRHGLPGNRQREAVVTTHGDFIPWMVAGRHTSHGLLARLKDCDRVLKGLPLRNGTASERFLEEWGRWMDGDNPTGKKLSVDYDPADSEGFFLVERRRGDRHRMRMPGPEHPARKKR